MKDYLKTNILLFAIPALFFALNANCQVVSKMVIQDVSLVQAAENKTIPHQDVVIENGKISGIFATGSHNYASNTTIIPGSGKFIMPGLAEMHAHIPGLNQGSERIKEVLFLYLANGVTTIRGMLGQPYHLELREMTASGEILGPRIFTSGPSLNGNSVTSKEEAINKVKAQKAAGYDFLKLHPGLTRENFDQIVATANEIGIPYAGHVSVDVGISRAIEAKYASIDHIDGYLEGLVPKSKAVAPENNGFFGINFTQLADQNNIKALVAATKRQGVWIVPTQCLMERWAGNVNPNEIIKEDGMQYMPKQTLGQWVNSKKNFDRIYNLDNHTSKLFISIRRNFIKAMNDEGVGLLLGSDSPQVFNVPGFSIHLELEAMVAAGLTPAEAIKTGTINPAKFFKMENRFGQIQIGTSADLIILNKNPLQNIGHIKERYGVVVAGNFINESTIQDRLKDIAENYK